MTAEMPESMTGLLLTELMESAINLALAADPQALERLAEHAGKVVRVKTVDPHAVFYLTLCETGIQLAQHHEELVHARIRVPATDLVRLLVGGRGLADFGAGSMRIAGDDALLRDLLAIAVDFNLWSVSRALLQRWLPEFNSMEDFLRLIREQDPAWMARLEHLPQLTHETSEVVKAMRLLQVQQTEELRRLREQLDHDRRAGQLSTLVGLVLVVGAFLLHNGVGERLVPPMLMVPSFEELLLLILALVILVPRLMGRR